MIKGKNNNGFTVIELLIATAVFSLVLLAAVSAFLEIGRMFYKGVITTQTQETAKQLLGSIVADIQDSPASGNILVNRGHPSGYAFFCAGNVRYTLNFDRQLDISDTNHSDKFGVLRDKLAGSTACAAPCDSSSSPPAVYVCDGAEVTFNNPQELLANNTRLNILDLVAPSNNPQQLYNVKVRLLAGDDGSLQVVNASQPATGTNVICDASLKISQFCSSASVSSVVFAGDYGP